MTRYKNPYFILGACVTIVCFVFNTIATDVSWAFAPVAQSPSSAVDVSGLKLPAFLGEVKEFHRGAKPKTVIHIQDAHCNLSAQKSIEEILRYLNASHGTRVIALEGGEGDYDLSVFADIKEASAREKVARYFEREGRVSGAELFAIMNPDKAVLKGVEDADLYFKNLAAYRNSLKDKEYADNVLERLSSDISALKERVYSPRLKELEEKKRAYLEKRTPLKDYLGYLYGVSKACGVASGGFTNLYRLIETVRKEGVIDFGRCERERGALITGIQKRASKLELELLTAWMLNFKEGRVRADEFYLYLIEKAESLSLEFDDLYPNLVNYSRYLKAYETVDKYRLFEELDGFEEVVFAAIADNDAQRTLHRISRQAEMLKKLFSVSLTRSEYDLYRSDRSRYALSAFASFLANESRRYGRYVDYSMEAARFDGYRCDMEQFYDYALKRDSAFAKNVKALLKTCDSVILISGGFHTENLKELFRKEGYSYAVILPKFDHAPTDTYFRLLSGGVSRAEAAVSENASAIAIASALNHLGADGKKTFELTAKILTVLLAGEEYYVDLSERSFAVFSLEPAGKASDMVPDKTLGYDLGEGLALYCRVYVVPQLTAKQGGKPEAAENPTLDGGNASSGPGVTLTSFLGPYLAFLLPAARGTSQEASSGSIFNLVNIAIAGAVIVAGAVIAKLVLARNSKGASGQDTLVNLRVSMITNALREVGSPAANFWLYCLKGDAEALRRFRGRFAADEGKTLRLDLTELLKNQSIRGRKDFEEAVRDFILRIIEVSSRRQSSRGKAPKAFEPLARPAATGEIGEPVGAGLVFRADAAPAGDIVRQLREAGMPVSNNLEDVISIMQRYFKIVFAKAPEKSGDMSGYEIEFRVGVKNYASVKGKRIYVDIMLVGLEGMDPYKDILPFLAFVIGHEGSHAIVKTEEDAQAMDAERFRLLSDRHQKAIINILSGLGANEAYLRKLKGRPAKVISAAKPVSAQPLPPPVTNGRRRNMATMAPFEVSVDAKSSTDIRQTPLGTVDIRPLFRTPEGEIWINTWPRLKPDGKAKKLVEDSEEAIGKVVVVPANIWRDLGTKFFDDIHKACYEAAILDALADAEHDTMKQNKLMKKVEQKRKDIMADAKLDTAEREKFLKKLDEFHAAALADIEAKAAREKEFIEKAKEIRKAAIEKLARLGLIEDDDIVKGNVEKLEGMVGALKGAQEKTMVLSPSQASAEGIEIKLFVDARGVIVEGEQAARYSAQNLTPCTLILGAKDEKLSYPPNDAHINLKVAVKNFNSTVGKRALAAAGQAAKKSAGIGTEVEVKAAPEPAPKEKIGRTVFAFNHHPSLKYYTDKLSELVAEADIVLVEEPDIFAEFYDEVSAGTMTPKELISRMEESGHKIFYPDAIFEIFGALYKTNKRVYGEPRLAEGTTTALSESARQLEREFNRLLLSGDPDATLAVYARLQDTVASRYAQRDVALKVLLDKLEEAEPFARILVIRGTTHTPSYIMTKKVFSKTTERVFLYPEGPVVYSFQDALRRKSMMIKLGLLPDGEISGIEVARSLVSVLIINMMTQGLRAKIDFALLNRVALRIKDEEEAKALLGVIKEAGPADISGAMLVAMHWLTAHGKWTAEERVALLGAARQAHRGFDATDRATSEVSAPTPEYTDDELRLFKALSLTLRGDLAKGLRILAATASSLITEDDARAVIAALKEHRESERVSKLLRIQSKTRFVKSILLLKGGISGMSRGELAWLRLSKDELESRYFGAQADSAIQRLLRKNFTRIVKDQYGGRDNRVGAPTAAGQNKAAGYEKKAAAKEAPHLTGLQLRDFKQQAMRPWKNWMSMTIMAQHLPAVPEARYMRKALEELEDVLKGLTPAERNNTTRIIARLETSQGVKFNRDERDALTLVIQSRLAYALRYNRGMLIGKWVPVTDIEFVETGAAGQGYVRFKAYQRDDPKKSVTKIEIDASRAPPEAFDTFKRTGISGIDMALEKFYKGFKGEILILDMNVYGIEGIGTAGMLAISDLYKNNAVALFHEMAHGAIDAGMLSVDEIIDNITGGRAALDKYLSAPGKEYRKRPEVLAHYALRLFQQQGWGVKEDDEIRLTKKSRLAKEAKKGEAGLREFEERAIGILRKDGRKLDELNEAAYKEHRMLVIPAFSGEKIEIAGGKTILKVARDAEYATDVFLGNACNTLGYSLRDVREIVYELCYNIREHGGGGIVTLRKLYSEDGRMNGIEIAARDMGPGIEDAEKVRVASLEKAMTDGTGRGFRTVEQSIFASEGSIVYETNYNGSAKTFVYDSAEKMFVEARDRPAAAQKGTRAVFTLVKSAPRPAARSVSEERDALYKNVFGMRYVELRKMGFSETEIDKAITDFASVSIMGAAVGFGHNDCLRQQLARLKEVFKRTIAEKRDAGREVVIYGLGLGFEPLEARDAVEAFYEALKAMGEDERDWKVFFVGVDAEDRALEGAKARFGEMSSLHPGLTMKTAKARTFIADEVIKLFAEEGQGKKADIILNRHVHYGNNAAAQGIFTRDFLAMEKMDNAREKALSVYLQLKNIMETLARKGAAYVVEPIKTSSSPYAGPFLVIPGAQALFDNASGIYRINDTEKVKSFSGFIGGIENYKLHLALAMPVALAPAAGVVEIVDTMPGVPDMPAGYLGNVAGWADIYDPARLATQLKREFREVNEETVRRISKGDILLVGPGRHIQEILMLFKLFPEMRSLTVVDINRKNLETIRGRLNEPDAAILAAMKECNVDANRIKLYHADAANKLPFENGRFDACYSSGAVDATMPDLTQKQLSAMAAQIGLKLKPDGVYFTSVSTEKYFEANGFIVRSASGDGSQRFVASRSGKVFKAEVTVSALTTRLLEFAKDAVRQDGKSVHTVLIVGDEAYRDEAQVKSATQSLQAVLKRMFGHARGNDVVVCRSYKEASEHLAKAKNVGIANTFVYIDRRVADDGHEKDLARFIKTELVTEPDG
ncbi:MAG: hypothetical protein JW919_05915, partial [Candidatus Omnitrophica bacterium]|nr:hypothetical protein [Candidatus Omnitrophota bacterium]